MKPGKYRNFGATGTASKKVPFVFTATWRLEDTGWRIIDAHESAAAEWPTAQ